MTTSEHPAPRPTPAPDRARGIPDGPARGTDGPHDGAQHTAPGRARTLSELVGLATPLGPYGFGASGISRPWTSPDEAAACVDAAWDLGMRYYDVAPMYGNGLAEERLGAALRDRPRSEYAISTKVGRRIDPDVAHAAGLLDDWVYDFSRDGIWRSVEESLARLGVDHVDVLFLHDPEGRHDDLLREGYPALRELREQGVVRAVGAGMQVSEDLTRLVEDTDLDLVLVAGRYTLLDPGALDDLLPACERRGVRALAAEALHGGLLQGVPHAHFNYRPVPGVIRDRVAAIDAVCRAAGVPTEAAALQLPLAHPVVDLVLTGPQTADQLRQNMAWASTPVPAAVWDELRERGLLRPDAPTPAAPPTIPGRPSLPGSAALASPAAPGPSTADAAHTGVTA